VSGMELHALHVMSHLILTTIQGGGIIICTSLEGA
jgi:hypothetical protein